MGDGTKSHEGGVRGRNRHIVGVEGAARGAARRQGLVRYEALRTKPTRRASSYNEGKGR